MTQAAMEYVLGFREVSVAIPGAKTKEQILDHIKASNDPGLGSHEISKLRELYAHDKIFTKMIF